MTTGPAAPGPRRPLRPLLVGMGWFDEQPGGLNRYLAELHRALEDLGEEPRALVLAGPVPLPASVTGVPAPGAPLGLRVLRFAAAAGRAAAGAGVVDAHFALYAALALRRPAVRRLPLMVHFQGPWAAESLALGGRARWGAPVKRAVERSVYRRADLVVALSAAFGRLVVDDYGVAPWRVEVVPPGVDLGRFRPGGGHSREAARADLALDPGAWVAVAARRLVPRMGVDVLVEAWPAVVAARPDAVLLVAGDGPEREALAARARRSGSGGSVRFLGRLDDGDLVTAYRAADVAVVPSVALEGFGLVTLEALACGTPVVVSDVGGLAEVPAGLDPGLVVPPGDPAALGRRLAAAAAGTEPLPDAGRCRAVAERHSWAEVAGEHVQLYRRLVAPGTGRLRVVYLDHVARLSGGELALVRLLEALEGVDAHVVLAEDGPLVARLEAAGASVEVLPLARSVRDLRRDRLRPAALPGAAPLGAAAHALRLARRLRVLRPDLVHTNSLKAALYGGAAARLAGVPAVWHLRDRIAPDYLPGAAVSVVGALSRWLPTAVIANSASTMATLPPAGGRRGLRRVVPSPVPAVQLPASRPAGDGLRFAMVGRLAPWKGQLVFLEAFARAFPTGPARAVVVGAALFGEEAYEQQLGRRARELGIAGRVDLRGHRDDVAAELAGVDVVVHASTTPEPFGQVVVEGMAAGLPVVAAAAGGPAEVVTDGVDGLLVAPGDVDALAAALRRLAADPDLRSRLGRAGRDRARQFEPRVVAGAVVELYLEVLGRSPG